MKLKKKDLLKETIKHFDIKKIDTTAIINAMRDLPLPIYGRGVLSVK